MTMPEPSVISDTTSTDTSSSSDVTTSNVADVVSEAPPSFIDPETIYSKLPDAFKEGKLLDEVLSDYNKRHNDALSEYQTKYGAFEPFVGQDPQKLAMALQVFDLIDNPDTARQVYDKLGEAYGYSQVNQAIQQQTQQQNQQPEEIPDEDLTDEQREIKALKEQIEGLTQGQQRQEQIYEQQVHQERTQQYGNEIDQALNSVYQVDPGIKEDPVRFNDLMNRVKFADQMDMSEGRQPRSFAQLVHQAHEEQKAYNQRLYGIFGQQGQSGSSTNAPRVMSPTGTTPAANSNYADMSENQLKDAAVNKLLEAMNQ